MKKIIFILFLILGKQTVNAQDYYMDVVSGTTVTTCRGRVLPTWLCGSFGGYAGYCNNENYTVTFYSGNPAIPLNISFLALSYAGIPTSNVFYTQAGVDKLTIIDGPSLGSPTLATLSGAIASPFSYSTTSAYMTINFKSNGSVNDWGWYALIGCKPQGCGGNLPASDICANATAICDLNGYCGSTSGWYTPDNYLTLGSDYNAPGPNTFCGSIENNSWIKFIPNSTNASINVNSSNCNNPASGIQAAIMNSANCSTFAVLACQSQAAGPGLMTLSYSSFIPGNIYYIMIDGYAGNACDYTVTANTGVAVSTINATSNTICDGQNTSLTAVSPGNSPTYNWSTGSTASNITVAPNVTTVYTATINTGFCSEVLTKTITVNPIPTSNAGSSPGAITCSNPTQILSGSGGGSYSWSGVGIVSGGSTANPVVNGAGPYSLAVTVAGCTSTNVTSVSNVVNTVPPVPATLTPNAITCGTPNINVAITPTAGMSYSWTGPNILSGNLTSSPLVNAPGNYTVLVTGSNGCTANAIINVTSSSAVTVAPSTSGNVTCTNPFINLSTPNIAGQSYTWTAPSGAAITSGANLAAATGSNSGTYTVTVLNTSNGCLQIGTIAANVNTTVPTATANITGVITCTSTAVNLNVNPAGLSYSWSASGGGAVISGSLSQSATGSGNGTYYVLVSNPANGCTVTKTVTPTVNTTTIAATINTPNQLMCNTTTVSLTGNPSIGVSYLWTAPSATNIVGGINNTQTIGVNTIGTYTLNLINTANGCPSTPTTVNVTQNLTQPTITAVTQTANLICGATSTVLSGSANPSGGTYTWTSAGGGFTGPTNNFFVSATSATVYVLTASHPVTGCTSSLSYTVIPDINSPTVSLSSNAATITCLNTSFTTTASVIPSSGNTFTWTGPVGGIVGSVNNPSITAIASGVYNLSVTASNNCVSNVSYVITANNTLVTPTASVSNVLSCGAPTASISLNVSGTGTFSYTWSGPSGFATLSPNFTTTTLGVYNVTVTNSSSGCTGTTNVTATSNFTAPSTPFIAANNITLTCAAGNATVITASSTGATSYSWTAPSGAAITSGSNSATANVTGTGVFTVVAIGGNGCSTAFFPVTATVNPAAGAPATALNTNSLNITCSVTNPSATANTTVSGVSYSWTSSSGSGIVGSTTNSTAIFNQPGTYSVVVTNTISGCATVPNSSLVVTVTNNNAQPIASIALTPTINCTNTVVTVSPSFTPNTSLAYNWTGGNIVGTTTNSSVQTNSNTLLTLSYTNTTNGCANTLTVMVVGNNVVPTLSLTTNSGGNNITCATPTLNYFATSTPTSGVTYLWSNGATTPNINVVIAGTYSVIATNTLSGCQTVENFTVGGGNTLPSYTTASSAIIPCGSATTNLNATSTNTNVSYIWAGIGILNGATTSSPIVGNAGTYTLLVTDNTTSCTVTQTVSVSNSSVVAQFTANPVTGPSPLTVNFTNQSIGASSYAWDFGNGTSTQTNPSNVYPNTGTFTVVLTSANGACSATATLIIDVKEGLGVIPEVFTPNGDQFNPTFEIKGLDSYPNNSLQVFNRWGNPVYTAKPYKNDWIGMPNVAGKTGSDKLPTGTYYYILDLGDEAKTIFRGYVQLQY